MEGFVLLEKRYLEIKRKRILGLKSLKRMRLREIYFKRMGIRFRIKG